jgi:branched-chain amino acid transport system ATP-binding protein
VLENVLVGLNSRISSSPAGLLFGSGAAVREEKEASRRALVLLDTMGMAEFAHRRASDLSGGQQRIVELVRTVAAKPRLLLLDEPAVGLSPAARQQLSRIVLDLARTENVGIVFIEHAMDMVMELADRIVVFSSGMSSRTGHPRSCAATRWCSKPISAARSADERGGRTG